MENNPVEIAKEIIEELKEAVEDGNYSDMEEASEYLSEYIEPYITYYVDCHEILKNYQGDTSMFDTYGKSEFNDIAMVYASQAIEEEVRRLL